ncbi:solute carrier organic anion transporter family member 2B1 isoform X1 [Pelodiscus sinensis]|uniref:Solute carrier organic anion transporter family member n=1 Tax=Pelodiscus sinensis TaxID=13735 RepID=K7GD89_PELSI|nr:solute carrier organic anion transporter family member 2B1 isoform X1 [Pelodiscus sinensis]XP_006127569.1 solute carrier organic anion transporter family member 2B1 isoform X1 [Pelodiscus sinensis]XP_006127570.1 solute carrier organic anion transporter family member 2B1 isoform X1 [Pelodiscus sinensis]XP_025042725.1 solute carrier organic anion transporter family member 2B1 isoform X1 [Pelodiscus sinensis]|eukprot:XP_006127568.1 solute carrier organic anion transporter family member 2B1 isoform X1 [Pelodiscus sinensis]
MTATVSEKSPEDQSKRICCKNPFLNIKFFVFCHGFLQLSQLLLSGYLKSSISTIEKRFGLSSQTSGLLASFNEVGNTLLIVFVSYFGSRVNRPRFIGCGAILVSIAGILMSVPHFITGRYEYDQSIASVFSNSTDLCQPDISISTRNLNDTDCTLRAVKESREVLLILFIGQTLLGVGGVPIQPFGISYIDDFASERNSPLYLGILFAVTIIGPGVAFMLGSAILRFYVDIDKIPPEEIQLTHKDPRWVGAWWLGFLVAATLTAFSAIPYFFFPKEMPKEVVKGSESEVKKSKDLLNELKSKSEIMRSLSLTSFIKIFPKVLLRNLRHPVYLLVVLAQVNLSAMVAGLATFMGKFLERQFSLTASFANMIIGSVNIPGAMVGIVVGGAIMKKFQMTLKQCGGMCVLGMLLCVIFALPLLFLGCPTQKVAGLNYRRSSDAGQHTFECNNKCNCLEKAYNPICGVDGIEYISPCFAGCEVVISDVGENKVLNYTHCRCISANGANGSASPGTCGTNCSHLLLPFVVLCCLAGILASTSHTPSFMLILRSVQPQDKSFAIGIQFLLLRVLAWMPGPVLYGSAIDTTCILWEKKCKKNAACRYYNNDLFRQRFLGLQFFFEVGAFLCFLAVFIILRRQERETRNATEPNTIPEKEKLAEKSSKNIDSKV